ncbi:hypothetical protein FRC09_013617, partial [Ceratobasidium sp. 395]
MSSQASSSQASSSRPSSSQLSPNDRFQPVAALPGVVECPELMKYDLAIASTPGILICMLCPEDSRTVNITSVRKHVQKHLREKGKTLNRRTETHEYFHGLCRRYNVQNKQ